MSRPVTERDLRMPEFADADPKDLEFRDDGKLVRKDRWEAGIRKIACRVWRSKSDFEVGDIVLAVFVMRDILVMQEEAVGDVLWDEMRAPAVLPVPPVIDQALAAARFVFEGFPKSLEALDYLEAILNSEKEQP